MEIVAHRTSRSGKTFIPDLPPEFLSNLKSLLGGNFRNKEELISRLLSEVKIVNFENKNKELNYFLKYTKNQIKFELCCKIFADLISAGWDISISRKPGVFIMNKPVLLNKADKKNVYLNKRNEKLLEPSVQKFIKEMEAPNNKEKKSIFEIIDDGKKLSEILDKINKLPENEKNLELKKIIKPEIVMCYPQKTAKEKYEKETHYCPITNLKLSDIWRYFRYTWTNVAETTPGRSASFIIRNAARKNKPIIGISMLRNGELGDTLRDSFIGWKDIESIRNKILKKEIKVEDIVKCLLNTIEKKIGELKLEDFSILNTNNIKKPELVMIDRLKKLLNYEKLEYEKFQKKIKKINDPYNQIYSKKVSEEDWGWLSIQPQNKIKRLSEIIELLECKIIFNKVSLYQNPSNGLARLISSKNPKDKQCLSTAVKHFREIKLNDHAADIAVCGPIDPYGEIIGGKLVTLLMASTEVKKLFKRRYEYYKSPSTISSSKKGAPVFRKADLVFMTVSSLYGNSSMYNRIKLLKQNFSNLKTDLNLKELLHEGNIDKTKGQGVNQFSSITTKLIQILRLKIEKYTVVRGRFGQGAGQKMRKTRGGLDLIYNKDNCTIREDDFVDHSIKKKKYIFCLTEKPLNYFLKDKPGNITTSSTKEITSAWIERWCSKRISKKETIDRIKNLGVESIKKNLHQISNF